MILKGIVLLTTFSHLQKLIFLFLLPFISLFFFGNYYLLPSRLLLHPQKFLINHVYPVLHPENSSIKKFYFIFFLIPHKIYVQIAHDNKANSKAKQKNTCFSDTPSSLHVSIIDSSIQCLHPEALPVNPFNYL